MNGGQMKSVRRPNAFHSPVDRFSVVCPSWLLGGVMTGASYVIRIWGKLRALLT